MSSILFSSVDIRTRAQGRGQAAILKPGEAARHQRWPRKNILVSVCRKNKITWQKQDLPVKENREIEEN